VLRRRLLLVIHNIFALGTNIGIKRLADGLTAADPNTTDTEAALRRVRASHITRDNLRAAIRRLVNNTLVTRDPDWWGDGTACASDSRKFGSWSSNLMTESHQRYRGRGSWCSGTSSWATYASTPSSRAVRHPKSRR